MPIRFTCPHCGATTLVDDKYANCQGPCATCGKWVRVQPPSRSAVSAAEATASEAPTVRHMRLALLVFLAMLVVLPVLSWLFVLYVIPEMRRTARRPAQERCVANLRQIAVALRAYHQVYGSFPPAVTRDADGKPLHSWRVLILPYLDAGDLYKQYDLREPWDSPRNLALITQMPDVYRNPTDSSPQSSGETVFAAVTGDGTVFPRSGTISVDRIPDGAARTVMIVESCDAHLVWTQPVDLPVTQMSFSLNSSNRYSIRTSHGDAPHVLAADGTVHALRPTAAASQIRGLFTIDGRETVRWSSIAIEHDD